VTRTEIPEYMRVVDETGHEEIGGKPVQPGVLIANDRYETLTHVSHDALAGMTVKMLEDYTAQGKNVEHLTRVTGYFSKVSGWNKGKAQELKDRFRGGAV